MTPALIVLLVLFVVLIAFSVPITFSIGVASLAALIVDGSVPLLVVPQRIFVSLDSFPMLAAPFFVIAGDIMLVGGISKRLVKLAKTLVGWLRGGLAYVTFLASALFGAISGSAVATTTAIGGLMYPEMVNAGYKKAYAAALGAVSGTLGVLIPPSMSFVIFGTQTGTSVSRLFLWGAVVGIFAMIGYCLAATLQLKKMDVKPVSERKPTVKEVWGAFKEASLGLLSPIIILGGIYSGAFTATEAAVVAIVYSIIVCMFVYRELSLKQLLQSLIKSSITSGAILMLTGVASLFSWTLTIQGFTSMIKDYILGLNVGKVGFLVVMTILYLILGMLMDTIPVIILTAPIFLPIATALGINAIHFGVLMVFNLVFGLFTPPFGVCVFVSNTYSKEKIEVIFGQCKYFFVTGVLMILIVTFLPLLF